MINKLKVILLIILLVYSCKNNEETGKAFKHNDNINKNWVGKNIIFPKSLVKFKYLNPNKKSKLSLIVYYNGDCGVCYLQLLKWNKIIENFRKLNRDISFKFILSGNSSAVVKANLEKIGFSLDDVYHDEKDEFGEKYSFLLDKGYIHSAMLLDENNKILYIGNPSILETTEKKYIELLHYHQKVRK